MAIRYWEGGDQLISYNSGSDEPTIGDTLTGGTSGATGIAVSWTLASGSWAGNDAAGVFTLTDVTGTWQNPETIENTTQSDSDIATTASTLTNNSEDWQTAKNWSGDTVPVNNDFIIFDARGNAQSETIYDVSDGIAEGESGGVTADLLHVKKGYTGDIGLVSEPLHLLPDKFIYEGSGTCYFEASAANNVSDGFVGSVICDTVLGTLKLDSNVNSGSWVQGFTAIHAIQGTLNIGANKSTWVITLYVMANNGIDSNLTITIGIDCERTKATAAQTTIVMSSGALTTNSDIGTFYFLGGTCTIGTDLAASPEVGHEIASLFMHKGVLNWNPDATATIVITSAFIYGGTIEASTTTNANRIKTIATMETFSGAILNLDNSRGNITVTSQLLNHGATIVLDKNVDLSWTYDTI